MYKIYDIKIKKVIQQFNTFDELLYHVAVGFDQALLVKFKKDWRPGIDNYFSNPILSSFCCSPGEKSPYDLYYKKDDMWKLHKEGFGERVGKQFYALDEYDRIINLHLHMSDMQRVLLNPPWKLKYRNYSKFDKWINYRYRYDPVPGVHKRGRWILYKSMFVLQKKEKSILCDKDHYEYCRSKRRTKNLNYSHYGKRPRRDWKRKKVSRQWMKNSKKHMDTYEHDKYGIDIEWMECTEEVKYV